MSFLPAVLSVALVAAIAAIISEQRGLTLHRYMFKPLPVLLMVPVVVFLTQSTSLVKTLFAVALLASATGDLLLIDRKRFLYGLLAFLMAHVCYVFGIWIQLEQAPRLVAILPLTLWGGALFWLVRKDLDKLKFPVLFYISVILLMIWLALERYHQQHDVSAALLLSGAMLFGLSDSLLAVDHFRGSFSGSRILVLTSYYLAQVCIACSLVGGLI